MRDLKSTRGVTLLEMMVAAAIFSMMVVVIFQVMGTAQRAMSADGARDNVEGSVTRFFDLLGRDVRESSYAYVYAGDWFAGRDLSGSVGIRVARNYFSSTPMVGNTLMSPGISNEGWAQCTNAACSWSNHPGASGMDPTYPMAYLARPTRNNPQTGTPVFPPPAFVTAPTDGQGRLFGHVAAGQPCPYCGQTLGAEAKFGGLMVFSARRSDGTFSYGGASGYEPQWESMIFYCPWRDPRTGNYQMRRYIFYASAVTGASATPANLIDLLDFDANSVIESPPMTDIGGNFLLDADGERFSLEWDSLSGSNALVYHKWDNSIPRGFEIRIDRATGLATVSVVGGPFAGVNQIQTSIRIFGLGFSDFDASTFINNPSWFVSGNQVNPFGVVELGVVRVTVQTDRPGASTRMGGMSNEETVQTTMMRPRN